MSHADFYNDDSESQETTPLVNKHVWACLLPMTKEMKPVDFFKPQTTYHIGRNGEYNSIVFPGHKISNKHAEITWDGKVSHESSIMIMDFSTNGTFVNGVKLRKGISHMLTDGAEIAFASTTSTGKPFEDYRYIFRHMASGADPKTGFFALYNLGNLLGQDSFSSVFHCIEFATGISWAAKMFYTVVGAGNAPPTSRAKKMISREISVLQQLSHPNICFLKDTFVLEDEKPVLVMELIESGDLLEHILSNLGINERLAQHITYQLCLALSYIHGLGIVHRDLKPENVLLTTDNPPNVKVAYFGIANAPEKHSMMKTICGIPAHFAPELVQQTVHGDYGHLADSWGMGAIVFSMLTNRSPFVEDESVDDVRDVRLRRVDWKALGERTNNPQIFDFIKVLLDNNPRSRMTVTDALDHPWLQDYVVRNGRDVIADRALGGIRGL